MGIRDIDIEMLAIGAAGLTIASSAAPLGTSPLLIEREKPLGGNCLHFGCVPNKALIRTARARRAGYVIAS